GACFLLAGYLFELLSEHEGRLDAVAVVGSVVPLGLGLSALTTLVEGHVAGIDLLGLALLGLAAVYGALAAGAFGLHRDLSTLLWALALVVAAGADAVLVSGAWLTLAWGASAAARAWSAWAAVVVAVYGLSLTILEVAERVAPGGDVKTNFQRGHTAVSAFWGALGLLLLYAGLTRRMRALRLGGFALFGVSLAKLFLYDLAFLNSVARALSFL